MYGCFSSLRGGLSWPKQSYNWDQVQTLPLWYGKDQDPLQTGLHVHLIYAGYRTCALPWLSTWPASEAHLFGVVMSCSSNIYTILGNGHVMVNIILTIDYNFSAQFHQLNCTDTRRQEQAIPWTNNTILIQWMNNTKMNDMRMNNIITKMNKLCDNK